MSGVASPTKAVRSFSWAAVHGSCCTTTRTPGCVRSNSGRSAVTTSPSLPIAQNRRTTSPDDDMRQPATTVRKATRAASRSGLVNRGFSRASSLCCREPAARKTGLLETTSHIGVLAGDTPDHLAPVVLDHRHDRSLVDAEIVLVDPAEAWDTAAVTKW